MNLLKVIQKPLKNHVKKHFLLIIIRMEQLRQQNAQEKNWNEILVTENTLLDLQKRKELEKDKKKEKMKVLKM